MASAYLVPGGYALLLWWFATGGILWLNSRRPASFPLSFVGATVLGCVAAWALVRESGEATPAGAYCAFTCAIALWGWLEIAFLMGFISGPRRTACDVRCDGRPHLLHAVQAVIYSDAVTALLVGAVYAATALAPNRVAFWTLLILWMMRLSAKLNLYLGVPNLGEAFLPPHLQYLRSFFRRRAMNALFPVSVIAASLAAGGLIWVLRQASDPFTVTSVTLALSLLLLGLLEHCFMVLPLPSDRLWSWALKIGVAAKSGRQTTRPTMPSDTARSGQSPPHSVRSTSVN